MAPGAARLLRPRRPLAVAALARLRCRPSVASLATPPGSCTQVWGATGITLTLALTLT